MECTIMDMMVKTEIAKTIIEKVMNVMIGVNMMPVEELMRKAKKYQCPTGNTTRSSCRVNIASGCVERR
eukprot:177966-Prorocentrum_lima.AAC.1